MLPDTPAPKPCHRLSRRAQNGGAAAEVRHDPHIENPIHRRLDDWAYPSEDEGVDTAAVRIVDEEAAIRVDVSAQAQAELAVRGLHGEAALAGCDLRRRPGALSRLFLIQLDLARQDLELR